MSNNLAHVRARETAEGWLAERRQSLPTPPRVSASWAEQAMVDAFVMGWAMATSPATEAEVNEIVAGLIRDAQAHQGTETADDAADEMALSIMAYLGAIHREEQDQWAVERATGQRQLDDARALMVETAELLRGYEAHHRDRMAMATTDESSHSSFTKAERNALAAARLEAWVAGEDRYPVSLDEVRLQVAEPGEPIPVITGWIDRDGRAHPDVLELPCVTSKEQAVRLARYDDPTRFTPVPGFTGMDPDILAALCASAGEPVPEPEPVIGRRVSKRGGDYEFDGQIVAVIPKRSGEVRFAVEDDRGLLLIMNRRQCGLPPEPPAARQPHHRPDGVADLTAFRLQTGDPRFDPGAPVCVNGYLYRPAMEA